MSRCPGCGAILDAPRRKPRSRMIARKCPSCLRWQRISARDELIERLRQQAASL